MRQGVYKIRIPEIVWLWLLLIAAVACIVSGMVNSWHWLTILGVTLFALYGWRNGAPVSRRIIANAASPINPATGSSLIPGTFTDSQGRYTGSSQ